jgi:hypothetical protein
MTGLMPDSQIPVSQLNTSQPGWYRLKPEVRAAILVSPAIILFEILSSLAPVAGFAITFPLALATYLVQGFLVGRLAAPGPLRKTGYMRLGALSGVWTGAVLSTAVTLVVLIIATPVSLGTFLLGLPAILAASLLDIGFNISLSALGAWLYAQLGGKMAAGLSCLLGLAGLSLTCGLTGGAAVLLAGLLSGKIHLH